MLILSENIDCLTPELSGAGGIRLGRIVRSALPCHLPCLRRETSRASYWGRAAT
jgi:hypothetical protein